MTTVAAFHKEIRAALVARTKVLNTSLTKIAPELLATELEALMNEESWQQHFGSEEEFAKEFRTAFKKEILLVAQHEQAAPEKIAAIEQLEEPVQEVAEPVQEVVEPAVEAPAEPQAEAQESTLDDLLTAPFYACEMQATQAVLVPFSNVDDARRYAHRRTHSDSVLTQTSTREQVLARYEKGSMLESFNLLEKPYRIGEEQPAAWSKKKAKPAAKAVAVAQPAEPTTAPAQPTPATPQEAKAKKPLPMKRQTIPEQGTPAQLFDARLSHLENIDQFHAFMEEITTAGYQLEQKSNHVPVEYLLHLESDTYEGGVCLRLRRARTDTQKIESKVYLHCIQRYYEVKPIRK